MKHIRTIIAAVMLIACQAGAQAKDYNYILDSPAGNAVVEVNTHKGYLTWKVTYKGEEILNASPIGIEFQGKRTSYKIAEVTHARKTEVLNVTVPTKNSKIDDHYSEITLEMRGGWNVTFRAYDNGVAYRIWTDMNGKGIKVLSEIADFRLAGDWTTYWANETNKEFITHCEADFKPLKVTEIDPETTSFLPLTFVTDKGTIGVITESDLFDYPNMFLKANATNHSLKGVFPHVIGTYELKNDRDVNITRLENYIAEIDGDHKFPWRVIELGDDKSILENTVAWQLATPEIEGDYSWMKPGKISWEWWSALNVYGVDFKAGVNTETYKYFIDFAAKYGLPYILLDEGWSKSTLNITECQAGLDVPELVRYGKEKGVGVVLWTLWTPMAYKMEQILDVYKQWGIAGIKIDFMQLQDQKMVQFYEKVASECAKRHLLVDFHGAFKPAGIQRKYPNAMTFEGVFGMEHDKDGNLCTPEHDLQLPFTRMVAGPMDYTPGAVNNATKDDYSARWYHPMSQGTRGHQAALFVCYESPLMMLCDSPSNYYKVPDFTEFIAGIPTTWDETKALEAKIGDYMVIARRHGDDWYISGMTDWTPRDFTISLDFLKVGRLYDATIFKDGVNADSWAEDYKIENTTMVKGDKVDIHMASGGGWTAILKPRY